MIDDCADAGFPAVIAFTGFKFRDAEDPTSEVISLEEGRDNCVAGFKKIIGHAEKRGVNICIEHNQPRGSTIKLRKRVPKCVTGDIPHLFHTGQRRYKGPGTCGDHNTARRQSPGAA